MRRLTLAVVLALVLAVVPVAGAAPVKRLAWNKVLAGWTVQAKKKHHAITCAIWSATEAAMDCTFYNPAVSSTASTFIKNDRHQAYGKTVMARYDEDTLDVSPHPGCTYGFSIYGPDLAFSRATVVNICAKGWLAKVPAAP